MDRKLIYNEILTLLKVLKREGNNKCTSINAIISQAKAKLGQNFLLPDEDIIHEEVHMLLLNNILMRAGQWGEMIPVQHLKLTEYGKKCLEQDDIIPLDPSGYIEEIKRILPQLDPVVLEYLSESITAFNRDLILSSTIILGVASEQAMLILMESFGNYISKSKQFKSIKEKLEGEDSIFRKYKLFKESLIQLPKNIKANFPQNFDVHIDTLFNFIRLNRNETGHPLGGGKDKNIQAANLQAFKSYLVDIYKLIDYFTHNFLE